MANLLSNMLKTKRIIQQKKVINNINPKYLVELTLSYGKY